MSSRSPCDYNHLAQLHSFWRSAAVGIRFAQSRT